MVKAKIENVLWFSIKGDQHEGNNNNITIIIN